MIVWVDRDFDAVGQERPCWMRARIMNVAEKLVRNRAGFNADVLLLDLLDQVWMHDEIEAMSDSLGAEKNGICKLGILS